MTVSYDAAKNPFGPLNAGLYAEGNLVTPDDSNDLATYARITAITAGAVKFLPARNADNDPITITVPVGWVCPWLVRKVWATGTAATLRTLEKAT